MEKFKAFLKRKDIEISFKRYFIDAMGAMASGLFASLLVGTILGTLGTQLGIQILIEIHGGNTADHIDGNIACKEEYIVVPDGERVDIISRPPRLIKRKILRIG